MELNSRLDEKLSAAAKVRHIFRYKIFKATYAAC